MADYLRFDSDSGSVLVEVERADVAGPSGVPATGTVAASGTGEVNAGLGEWVRTKTGGMVAVARTGFADAIRAAVGLNVPAFLDAAEALAHPPDEMEITFGLKANGEAGNIAVGKVAGECSYQVRMLWRRPD